MGVNKQLGKRGEEKAPGPDNMHPRVLGEVAEQIRETLMDIFNSSL